MSWLHDLFINEAKPALWRHSGSSSSDDVGGLSFPDVIPPAGVYRHGSNFTELLYTWDEIWANGEKGEDWQSDYTMWDGAGYIMGTVGGDIILPDDPIIYPWGFGEPYWGIDLYCGNVVIPAWCKDVDISVLDFKSDDSTYGRPNSTIDCNLETIYIKATTPPPLYMPKEYVPYLTKIVVPKGCADAYKSATGWCDYAEIIEEADGGGTVGTYIPSVAAGIYRHGSNFTELLYPWDEIWMDGEGNSVGNTMNANAGDHSVMGGDYPTFDIAGDLVIPSKVWVTGIVKDIWIMQLVCGNVVFGDNPELTIYGLSDSSYYYTSSLAGCHMEAIYCKSEIPPTLDACLTDYGEGTELPYLTKVVVPKGCADAYKSETNWSIFADIIMEADA